MSALTAVRLSGPASPWRALGLAVTAADTIRIGAVTCEFTGADGPGIEALGVVDLGVVDLEGEQFVDGLEFFGASPQDVAPPSAHPCGALRLDHIVVTTSSLERTCGAVEAAIGAPLKRIREVGNGVRQGFHRLGEVILEVVESPQNTGDTASFWGLVVVVEDLEAWAASLGSELVSPPKRAVQPGRLIAGVRREAGLPCSVAFMSP